VDETIEVPGGLFYRLSHIIVAVEIEDVGDEIERILVVLDFRVKASQVKSIRQVILVDLAEVLVAS